MSITPVQTYPTPRPSPGRISLTRTTTPAGRTHGPSRRPALRTWDGGRTTTCRPLPLPPATPAPITGEAHQPSGSASTDDAPEAIAKLLAAFPGAQLVELTNQEGPWGPVPLGASHDPRDDADNADSRGRGDVSDSMDRSAANTLPAAASEQVSDGIEGGYRINDQEGEVS